MDSIIPDYNKARHELERAREAVRRKIERLCVASGKETVMPSDLKHTLEARMNAFLDEHPVAPKMRGAEHDILRQYADGLFLKTQLRKASPPDEKRYLPYMDELDKRVAKEGEGEVTG